jgi:hypothetical protein
MRLASATLAALLALSASAIAQTNASPTQPSDSGSSNPAVTVKPKGSPESTGSVEPGSNSFTEGQARSRIEAQGFTNVMELRKDEQGVWRGRADRNGQTVNVLLDYRGNVAAQ